HAAFDPKYGAQGSGGFSGGFGGGFADFDFGSFGDIFEDLFEGMRTKDMVIVTFLALLELLRLGLVRAYQERAFSIIWIFKKDSQINNFSYIEKK
ncbi:MAG: hypothetical protein N2257_09015, partial [Thermodesulfovibrionales bacterium]|nr:hypothetical protein [Thermodesulfovibrionales bacterium]